MVDYNSFILLLYSVCHGNTRVAKKMYKNKNMNRGKEITKTRTK